MRRFIIFVGGLIFLCAAVFHLVVVQPTVQDFENQMAIYGPMISLGGAEAQAEIQEAQTGIAVLRVMSFGGMALGGLLVFLGYKKRNRRDRIAVSKDNQS